METNVDVTDIYKHDILPPSGKGFLAARCTSAFRRIRFQIFSDKSFTAAEELTGQMNEEY